VNPQILSAAAQLRIVKTAGELAGYSVLHLGAPNLKRSYLLQSPLENEIPLAYASEQRAWASRIAWIQDLGSALEFAYEMFLRHGELTVITTANHTRAICAMHLLLPRERVVDNEETALLLAQSILICCIGLENKRWNVPLME
jgi:hypothetical protein